MLYAHKAFLNKILTYQKKKKKIQKKNYIRWRVCNILLCMEFHTHGTTCANTSIAEIRFVEMGGRLALSK
jgi:hypothetical protein